MQETENVFESKNSKKSILAEAKKLISENPKSTNLLNGYLEEDEIDLIEGRIRTCFARIQEKYNETSFWDEIKKGKFNKLTINAKLDKILSNYTNQFNNYKTNSWHYNKPSKTIWTNFNDELELEKHFKAVLINGNNETFIKRCQDFGVFTVLDLNLLDNYWDNYSDEIKNIIESSLSRTDVQYFNLQLDNYYRNSLVALNEKMAECRIKQLNNSKVIVDSLEKFIAKENINPFAKWKLNIAIFKQLPSN